MILPPPPPSLDNLRAGEKLKAGLGESTILPDLDFETYSPAGFVWNHDENKFESLPGANDKGLFAVGTAVYSEHPDAEVLSLAFDLKDGNGRQLWIPSAKLPYDLLNYVIDGGFIEAWNSSFEHWIWNNICVPKYGFPPLPIGQLRCAAAKARAFALPGSLENAGNVLKVVNQKDKDGKRLLNKFSIPRNPTKSDQRLRILTSDPTEREDATKLYEYNLRDIQSEAEISALIPDLNLSELEFWICDQRINYRGIKIDIKSIESGIKIVTQALKKYNYELQTITKGEVGAASEIQKLTRWARELCPVDITINSLDEDSVNALLENESIPPEVRRALEIRQLVGSAAVKKLYAMKNRATKNNRLHDLFIYHSARTGRAAGAGVQPQNMPNGGVDSWKCGLCGRRYGFTLDVCPWCNCGLREIKEWDSEIAESVLEIVRTGSLECVEYYYGDAMANLSGCLRGLFIAEDGHDLICSDYSAIEAVVLAALAGEEWRMEVFRTHGQIYEMSASKITGMDFDEFALYKSTSGQHHPYRKRGKVAELASGYGGWIGAWKQFGADEFSSDEEIKSQILAWRAASPAIVEFWGGQERNWRKEYFGLEGAAISAVLSPGTTFSHRGISYLMYGDVLYCTLLSGRHITYHKPRLENSQPPRRGLALSFEGWNTNPKNGGIGWIRMYTYGGKLTENVVQATARDILAHAIVSLEHAEYPIVLHVHDEIVSEVKKGFGSIEEFERIMCLLPLWARGWPIRAQGGWRAKRYRK